jgi:hypothetical protein
MLGGTGDDILDAVDDNYDTVRGEDGYDTLFGDYREDDLAGGADFDYLYDEFDYLISKG